MELETLNEYRRKVALALTDCYIDWYHRNFEKEFYNLNFNKNNALILDGGCGWGRFFPHYLKKKFKIVGIDIQKKRLEKLKNYDFYKKNKRYIKLIHADLNDIYLKQRFDIIFLWGVMVLIKDPKKLLDNLKNLLKKDGYLVLTIPRKYSIGYFSNKIFKYPSNFYFYRISDLNKYLKDLTLVKEKKCQYLVLTSFFGLIAGLFVFISPKILDALNKIFSFLPLPPGESILVYKK